MKDNHNQDFNEALNIYENNFSHEELINLLKDGSVAEKQAAALKLDSIKSKHEAEILISNLTGCDGKIREAVSFRLKEFVPQNPEFYIGFVENFLDAIIDINGNICRNTIESVKNLISFDDFSIKFYNELLDRALKLSNIVKDFDIQDGKYKINKEVFKLYWYLETICIFGFAHKKLEKLLTITSQISDYTIREKTAKILSNVKISSNLSELKEKLQNDENYYVRRY